PLGHLSVDRDRAPARSHRVVATSNNASRARLRFTGSALEFSVSAGSWVSISVNDLSPDDFVAEVSVRPLDGEGTIAFWFRGSAGRQDQVRLAPVSGELTVQVVRSFEGDPAPQRLFGPATRLPPSRTEERTFAVAARAKEIVIYLNGNEVARATDSATTSGAL